LSNLHLRGNVYYARFYVPKQLHELLQKREVWKSLRTRDRREAKRRLPEATIEQQREFDALLSALKLTSKPAPYTPSMTEMEQEAHAFYLRELEHDDHVRLTTPAEVQIDHETDEAKRREMRELRDRTLRWRKRDSYQTLPGAREDLASGNYGLSVDFVDIIAAEKGWALPMYGVEYNRFAALLLRARIELWERVKERDHGNWNGTPKEPFLLWPPVEPPARSSATIAVPEPNPAAEAPQVARSVLPTLDTLFASFREARSATLTADTLRTHAAAFDVFTDFVGKTEGTPALTKPRVREWRDALKRYPTMAAQTKELRGLAFQEAIAKNKELGRPTLNSRTINKYLSAVGAFSAWAVREGYLGANPTEGLYLEKERKKDRRTSFTDEQLRQFLQFGSGLSIALPSITPLVSAIYSVK